VLDASHVGLFDGIALALLELSLPPLSDESSAGERDCIYLNGQQCALPAEWRTIKCWSFYCLGGRWDPRVSLGEHHGALARALKDVVLERLPEDLRRYERLCGDPLISHLDDPTAFAQALDDALYEIMVSPLRARYVLLGERPARGLGERAEALSLEERVLCFVSQAMDALLVSGTLDQDDWPLPPDQLLADLELLEWIVMGRPSSQVQLLREMQARYAHLAALPGGGQPAVWQYLSECVDEVLETCD
jgi:hypothetical protein